MSRKKVVVTGASSGIGRATATRFGAEGWDVCVMARRESELDAVLAGLPSGEHFKVVGDYSKEEIAARLESELRERWGRLDALVNCAGVSMGGDPVTTSMAE